MDEPRAARRVLHVIDGLGGGGAERSLSEFVPAARSAGWESTVVCLYRRADGVHGRMLEAGLDVRFLESGSMPGRVRALGRLLDEIKPDVVHSTLINATLVARLACRRRQLPLVTSLVNTPYSDVRRQDRNVRPLAIRAVQAVDRTTGRWTDRFHAITQAVADAAVSDLGIPADDITVIHRGRDGSRLGRASPARRQRARQALGLDEAAPVVLTVGRVEFQKGHVHLVRAMARVIDEVPGAVALIAGRDGMASDDVRSLLAELDLGERVRLLGHRDDVPALLASADVFTFPSLYEGLGGSLIEAMALGLPIVASDVPAIREVLEPGANADLVAPADPAALAAALSRMLRDPARAATYGARSRQRFERHFTLEASTAAMLSLYDELAGAGRDARPTRSGEDL